VADNIFAIKAREKKAKQLANALLSMCVSPAWAFIMLHQPDKRRAVLKAADIKAASDATVDLVYELMQKKEAEVLRQFITEYPGAELVNT
jgi:hypothetical protein